LNINKLWRFRFYRLEGVESFADLEGCGRKRSCCGVLSTLLIHSGDCLFRLKPGYKGPTVARRTESVVQVEEKKRQESIKKEQEEIERKQEREELSRIKPEEDPHLRTTTSSIAPPKFPCMIEWAGPIGVKVMCAGSWEWAEHIEL
jgi:hypothetical protein